MRRSLIAVAIVVVAQLTALELVLVDSSNPPPANHQRQAYSQHVNSVSSCPQEQSTYFSASNGADVQATDAVERITTKDIALQRVIIIFQQAILAVIDLFRSILRLSSNAAVDVRQSISSSNINNDATLIWDGVPATEMELQSVLLIKQKLREDPFTRRSKWARSANNVELLRFLRARNGSVDLTWKMILSHIRWRSSSFGAEAAGVSASSKMLTNSMLRNEMFWLGPDKRGVPTLVVRTQVHDGELYNDDPREYCKFLVHNLERGKELFGCGVHCQVNLLLDRGGTITRNGQTEHESTNKDVIPKLVALVRHLFKTLQDNYPDMLGTATVVPASWFFRLCYQFTSQSMDQKTRSKFNIISGHHAQQHMQQLFSPEQLPEHLGGTSTSYLSDLVISYPTK